jgi:hypothetical protein
MMLTSSADTGTELELGDDMPFDGALTEFLSQIDDDDNVSNGPRARRSRSPNRYHQCVLLR